MQQNHKKSVRKTSIYGNWTKTIPSSTLPAQQGRAHSDCCSKEHRALSPPGSQWMFFFFPPRSKTSAFFILPPANCCWGQVLGEYSWEVGAPFFCPAPICEIKGSTLGTEHWEYWTCKLPCRSLWQQWFYTKRGKPRGPKTATSPLPSNQLLHTVGMSLKEKHDIVHNPSSRGLAQILSGAG